MNALKNRKTHRMDSELSWMPPPDRTDGCGAHMVQVAQCSGIAAAASTGAVSTSSDRPAVPMPPSPGLFEATLLCGT